MPFPLDELVARYARTHGPFTVDEAAGRLGTTDDRVLEALRRLEENGRVVVGDFRPGGSTSEWCDDGVLRVLRRRSLAALRREVEPVDPETFARFLPAWHGIGQGRRGLDALVAAIEQLQGAAIPASALERDVLPARVDGYRPSMLDELCAAGELVWVGAGPLGDDDGRVRLCFRDRVRLLVPARTGADAPSGPLHDAIRNRLTTAGASFWLELLGAAGNPDQQLLLNALWDLVWAGEVTNDTFGPVRAPRRAKRRSTSATRRPQVGRLSRLGPPAASGRWSLVAPLLEPQPTATEAVHALALQLLERHGVVTREGVKSEGIAGGYAAVYPVLRALEDSGGSAGVGSSRRSAPRSSRSAARSSACAPNASRPTNRARSCSPRPIRRSRTAPRSRGRRTRAGRRAAAAYAVLVDGELAAYLERGGRGLLTFASGAEPEVWIEAIVAAHKEGRLGALQLQRIDDGPARQSPLAPALRAAGFVDGYRGLTLRS